jgi:hypothetical protein
MIDPLYNKIIEGLVSLSDGDKFEACANSLLREKYPFLTWIKGGNDAGFDGAGARADGTKVQLICTTQDNVIGNVTNSLTRARDENLKSDVVLIAASRQLSPEQKRNLEVRVAEFGKTALPVEDQPAFAELLYHSPRWRKELLGIPGHSPPLSLFPVSDRVFLPLPPIGRDAEISCLTAITVGDLVVFGQPGAGKTHLLAHVAKSTEGLFLVSESHEAIMDGIRAQRPKWIIVDDAKARLAMLTFLRQARIDTGAEFRIVAACWPGQEDEVAAALSTTEQKPLEVGQLPQSEIKQIINATGLGGPDELLAELIDQASGKPGLAVTLARLSFRGTIRDVFTGKALARDVKRSLTELAGKEAVGLLGYFALAGDAGLKLSAAAELAKVPPGTTRQLAVAMGAAGVLQILDGENLLVEPVRLRQALVAEVFCQPGLSLDWEPLLPAMPDVADTLVTLICACAVGGKVDDRKLQEHIEALARGGGGVGEVCTCYVQLGRIQSLWVLDRFPGMLQKVADHVLVSIPQEALPLLIKADLERPAAAQNRERLKPVENWINAVALKPETVQRRELVLKTLREMDQLVKDTPTLLAALAHIFSLRFERTGHRPGEPMKLFIEFGPIPLTAAERLAALWPHALLMLTDLSTNQTGMLTSVIEDWVHPTRLSDKLPAGYADACRAHARVMLTDLIRAYTDRWAVLRRFSHFAESLGLDLPAATAPLVAILYPPRSSNFEIEERKEHKDAVLALSQRWIHTDSIPQVIGEWIACEREAHEHGLGYRELSRILAQEIASKSQDVRSWLMEMCAQGAPASLVWSFVWHACDQDKRTVDEFVLKFRDHPEYSGLAVECLLLFSHPGLPAWDSCRDALFAHAGRIGGAVLQNRLEDETVLWLLENGSPAVQCEVASNLWSANPRGQVPEPLRTAWGQAVIDHLGNDHEWEGISKQHPDIACAWLKKRINQTYQERHEAVSDFTMNHYLPAIVSSLTKDQRRELIDHFAEGNWQCDLLTSIVGGDIDLMRHALTRPATAKLASHCLDSPEASSNGWAERAVVLFDHGLTAKEVLSASQPGSVGGWGNLSDHYEKRRMAYVAFVQHVDARVREVCVLADAMLTACRDDALRRERKAAVSGDFF